MEATVINDSYLDIQKKEILHAISYVLTEPGEVYDFSKARSGDINPLSYKIHSSALKGKELKLLLGTVMHELELNRIHLYSLPLDIDRLKPIIKDILQKVKDEEEDKEV